MAIFGVGLLVVPPMVSQVQGLADDIPGYLQDLRKNEQFRKYDQKYDITTKLSAAGAQPALQAGDRGRDAALGHRRRLQRRSSQLVTVLTMTFFLLRDGGRIVGFLFGLAGPEREQRLRADLGDVYRSVSGYVAGNLLISVIAGTTTYVTLTILGVPFAVPLAVLMAFLDLIPLIGATIGGVIVGHRDRLHRLPHRARSCG